MAGTETASIRADELYTLDQLKWRLGISDSAFRSLRDAGLPEITRGKRKYFLGKRVMEWFAADDPGLCDPAPQEVVELPAPVADGPEVVRADKRRRQSTRRPEGSPVA
jgi:hypothetical protein